MAEHVISAQKELKILSNEFVTQQRAFFTPEGSTLSSSRPREVAGKPIEHEIRLLNKVSVQKYDPYNLNAIRSNKGRVMVKWTNKDNKKGCKPG